MEHVKGNAPALSENEPPFIPPVGDACEDAIASILTPPRGDVTAGNPKFPAPAAALVKEK